MQIGTWLEKKKAHVIMKPAQKLDAASLNSSREQMLLRKADRIWMAISPQTGEGAEAF